MVLGLNVRQRLVNRKIISLRSNNRSFDVFTLPKNANIPIIFPDCSFHQVPFKLNTEAFLEYFGIITAVWMEKYFISISKFMSENLNGKRNLKKEFCQTRYLPILL